MLFLLSSIDDKLKFFLLKMHFQVIPLKEIIKHIVQNISINVADNFIPILFQHVPTINHFPMYPWKMHLPWKIQCCIIEEKKTQIINITAA